MSRVFYCIPSARPDGGTLSLWRDRGYAVAAFRNIGAPDIDADLVLQGQYPGYAQAVNALCSEVLERWPETEWLVTGGDDVEPETSHTPAEIAEECSIHFAGTLGIMQPTGHGHGIDTICGSPWMGRDWCKRGYGGNGPLWGEYTHMFVDSDLQHVAKKLGILWQRSDLSHVHRQWQIEGRRMPEFLAEVNSPQHWQRFERLFRYRQSNGFPGHEVSA